MKEVTSMKTYMTITTMLVLTLTFGFAYADEFPIPIRNDVGTELYLSAFPIHDSAVAVKDFGVIGKREPEAVNAEGNALGVEIGTALYKDFLMKDTMMARSEAKGSAAGGVAREDEYTRIWDHVLGPGGSDLP